MEADKAKVVSPFCFDWVLDTSSVTFVFLEFKFRLTTEGSKTPKKSRG